MEIITSLSQITFLDFEANNASTVEEIKNLEQLINSAINSLSVMLGDLQMKKQTLIVANNSIYRNELSDSTLIPNKSIYIHYTDFMLEALQISNCNSSIAKQQTIDENTENEDQTMDHSMSSTDLMSKETKKFNCQYCSRVFPSKIKLRSHIRIHTQIKKYKCGICQSAFPVPSKLEEHMRIHTGEKPFKCEKCSLRFSKKSTLIRHYKVHS